MTDRTVLDALNGISAQSSDVKSLLRAYLKSGDPLDYLIRSHYLFYHNNLFHRHYDEWVTRRVRKILELYEGEFDIRVLELGGGLGDVGAVFAALGASVVSLEGRRINQRLANIKYRKLRGFQSVLWDVEEDFTHFGSFDLVLALGIIEMVKDPEPFIHRCAQVSDRVFVDTMVIDSEDSKAITQVPMETFNCDDPLHGFSCRPSPSYIERLFEERGFSTLRVLDPDLNTTDTLGHTYDWKHGVSPNAVDAKYRRFWYFKK